MLIVEQNGSSVPEEKKLPKLKFLKATDFSKGSDIPELNSPEKTKEAYFDNDYAKVEMVKLKPKPNLGDSFKKKAPDAKFLYNKLSDQPYSNQKSESIPIKDNFDQSLPKTTQHTFTTTTKEIKTTKTWNADCKLVENFKFYKF